MEKKEENAIAEILGVQYPIIQAGMVWCSGWRLAATISNHGGLGTIGSGSMRPDTLKEHLAKVEQATTKPYAVNVPLMYKHAPDNLQIIAESKAAVVITSAGNPKLWTAQMKDLGKKVIHVVSSAKFAQKAEDADVDAVIAEGFEAGGHNGREETTTFCLIPLVKQAVSIPVIAAGGINSGSSMLAAMVLGASAVQIGSAFAVATESSAHQLFKEKVIAAREGDTKLSLKKLAPVRLLKNAFYEKVQSAEQKGADEAELRLLLGKGRSRIGIFEGDLEGGELEIGQVSAMIDRVEPAADILNRIVKEYQEALEKTTKLNPYL